MLIQPLVGDEGASPEPGVFVTARVVVELESYVCDRAWLGVARAPALP
jgi:hypothetical protein